MAGNGAYLRELLSDERAAVEDLDEVRPRVVQFEVHLQRLATVDRIHTGEKQDARLELLHLQMLSIQANRERGGSAQRQLPGQ